MNKRRLTISFFLGMLATTVASLSFSFAWYATASRLNIEAIDIAVDAERRLTIATVNQEDAFVDHLRYEDLRHDVGRFAPVSSVFSDEWISSRASTPTFYDQSLPWELKGEPDKDPAHYGFYSQDFYIDCDDDVFVTIDREQTFIMANEGYNKKYAKEIKDDYPELTEAQIVEKLNLIPQSMRISILVPLMTPDSDYAYYVIDPNKGENDEEVLFGGILDNKNQKQEHYYDCYLDNGELYETVYGDVNDRNLIVYDEELTTEDSVIVGERSAFNAIHRKGSHKFNYEASKAKGMKFATEKSISYSDLEKNPKLISIPVYGYSVGARRIVVSIYIEGWDLRSINSTMGASFLANLSFEILQEM